MSVFVAHPSVRMRGTEQAYVPVLCQDEKCPGREKGVHMHCPLCSVAEPYQDPVILRAHFRVKHVDKSIDFAGLKVLRCCNHCEIVGTIKGEKRFKGAHWHCYRCRNGFNRRDEAIKHFKTHFRNPHTTFQIQVNQNVNCRQYYCESSEAHVKAYEGLAVSPGTGGEGSIGPSGDETLLTVEPKEDSERNGIPLGAEEEVGASQNSCDGTQTLVLMEPDGQGSSVIYDTATGILTEQETNSLEQTFLQRQVLELRQQIGTLRQEKEKMESTLRTEIKQLKDQVASLVQSNVKMFEELQTFQCPDHSGQKVAKLMESLEAQHRKLLQAQLASLRKELLSTTHGSPINGHMVAPQLSVSPEEPQTEVSSGPLSDPEVLDVQLETVQLEMLEFQPTAAVTCLESLSSDLALPDTGLESKSSLLCKKRSQTDDSEETVTAKVQRVS